MKKLLAACLLSLTMLSACNKTSGELDNNKAYLFYSQTCPHCHEPVLPHRACKNCGYYDGKQVIDVSKKENKD